MNRPLGEALKRLREESGMTQQQVAEQVGVTAEYISMVEGGRRVPSLSILHKLAALFNRDVSAILTQERPVFTLLLRAEGLGPAERRDLNRFVQMCENYAYVEKLAVAMPPLVPAYDPPSPLLLKTYKGMARYGEQLAEWERKRLGLGDEPIRDVFLLLEQQGVHPIRLKLEGGQLAGAFVFSPEAGAFILINAADSKERQMFTAAHEYCHYLKDRADGMTLDEQHSVEDPKDDHRPPKEVIANIFAANFLMPASSIGRVLVSRSHVGPEEVIYLKQYFGVSFLAMVCRLHSLGWIRKDEAEEMKKLRPGEIERRFFASQAERVDNEEEIPSRFFRLAVHVYSEGNITLSKLAELLRSNPPELRRLLEQSHLAGSLGGGSEEGPR